MEEEGDLRLLVFLAMEYEIESSRTACSVVPTPSKVEEGVFIVVFKIWPLDNLPHQIFFEEAG